MFRIAKAARIALPAFVFLSAQATGQTVQRAPVAAPKVTPPAAPMAETCSLANNALDDRIAACTRYIAAGKATKHELSLATLYRANAFRLKGDPMRSLADYGEAIRLDPANTVALNIRGLDLLRRGELDRAIADFSEAIRIDAKGSRAFANRAEAYLGRHDFAHAIADFTEAIGRDAKFARAFSGRGQAYAGAGDTGHAIEDLTTTLALIPNDAATLTNRGIVYERQGETLLARADFSTVLAQPARDEQTKAAQDLARQRLAALGATEVPPGTVASVMAGAVSLVPLTDPLTSGEVANAADLPALAPPPLALDIRPLASQRSGVVAALMPPAAPDSVGRRPNVQAIPSLRPDAAAPILGPPETIAPDRNGLASVRPAAPPFSPAPVDIPSLATQRSGAAGAPASAPPPSSPIAAPAGATLAKGSVAPQPATAAARRVALVIGNSSYLTLRYAPNPINDAADMASALRQLGFAVTLALDLRRADMDEALARFSGEAKTANTALVYYSGYGLAHMGENYLVPIDARVKDAADLRRLVKLKDVIDDIAGARQTRIVIVDASRNNEAVAAFGRGFADIGEFAGTLIASSAQPGEIGPDVKSRNSLFTQVLLKRLRETPGLAASVLMDRVRDEVAQASHGAQRPAIAGGLTEAFAFKAGP